MSSRRSKPLGSAGRRDMVSRFGYFFRLSAFCEKQENSLPDGWL